MYGTTIRSFNENKDIRNKKTKKEKSNFRLDDNKKEKKMFEIHQKLPKCDTKTGNK